MKTPFTRRAFVRCLLASSIPAGVGGCGTVLHPERRGQPAGSIDWGIFALDAIGLIFFFIPGVIAFAVDFSTGAIYLPPNGYGSKEKSTGRGKLVTVRLPKGKITHRDVEEVVSAHVEREVHLLPGTFQSEELKTIDAFWPTHQKHAGQKQQS